VVSRRPQIPGICSSRHPRSLYSRGFLYDGLATWRGEGVSIPIVRPIERFICQDCRVDSRFLDSVYCVLDLRCQFVPQLEWEVAISCCQGRHKCIFECLDCPLCSVDTVIVWFHQLHSAFLVGEKLFDDFCCLTGCP
jgi:hypothetical protein